MEVNPLLIDMEESVNPLLDGAKILIHRHLQFVIAFRVTLAGWMERPAPLPATRFRSASHFLVMPLVALPLTR